MICPNCFCQTQEDICPECNYNQSNARVYSKALPAFEFLNNKYQLGRVLGRGGFGITYVARNIYTDEIVAIKECVPDEYSIRVGNFIKPKVGDEAQFQGCIRCFLNEEEALENLKANPGVVKILDCFSENGTEYFAMEFINGVTLKYLTTKNGGILPFENCVYIFLCVGSILMEIHRQGILHRDISPENIMLSSDGLVKLIDFGAVKNYHSPRKDEAVFLKPGFAPPEQYEINGNQGPWTDIYALGATFYTIASGQPLIDAKNRKERDTMKSLFQLECGFSQDLSRTIERSMALDVDKRYCSVSVFLDAMDGYAKYANGLDSSLMKYVNMYRVSEHRSTINGKSLYSGVEYPYVEVLSGNSAGKKERIPDYGFILIGKDEDLSDIVIDDSNGVSRRHCMVGFDRFRNRFIVIDRSTNGTFFSNGTRMMIDSETYLQSGDEFFIISEELRIKVELS